MSTEDKPSASLCDRSKVFGFEGSLTKQISTCKRCREADLECDLEFPTFLKKAPGSGVLSWYDWYLKQGSKGVDLKFLKPPYLPRPGGKYKNRQQMTIDKSGGLLTIMIYKLPPEYDVADVPTRAPSAQSSHPSGSSAPERAASVTSQQSKSNDPNALLTNTQRSQGGPEGRKYARRQTTHMPIGSPVNGAGATRMPISSIINKSPVTAKTKEKDRKDHQSGKVKTPQTGPAIRGGGGGSLLSGDQEIGEKESNGGSAKECNPFIIFFNSSYGRREGTAVIGIYRWRDRGRIFRQSPNYVAGCGDGMSYRCNNGNDGELVRRKSITHRTRTEQFKNGDEDSSSDAS
ncbi:hypothetical protein QFC20_004875 [Naganishia adeliensis]|uniref:Uncharacterized protein n=1 Tax=Naganishia adeliensis TaxID=92952 RepID=A0ACC2VTZ2_9TREE|nr:hypothetical protein QFC20_004875 [Naganishia adeliensis]